MQGAWASRYNTGADEVGQGGAWDSACLPGPAMLVLLVPPFGAEIHCAPRKHARWSSLFRMTSVACPVKGNFSFSYQVHCQHSSLTILPPPAELLQGWGWGVQRAHLHAARAPGWFWLHSPKCTVLWPLVGGHSVPHAVNATFTLLSITLLSFRWSMGYTCYLLHLGSTLEAPAPPKMHGHPFPLSFTHLEVRQPRPHITRCR